MPTDAERNAAHQEQAAAAERERAAIQNKIDNPPPQPVPHGAFAMAGALFGIPDGLDFCCECLGIPRRQVLDDAGQPIPDPDDISGTGFRTVCEPPAATIELVNGFLNASLPAFDPVIGMIDAAEPDLPALPALALKLPAIEIPLGVLRIPPELPGMPGLPDLVPAFDMELPDIPGWQPAIPDLPIPTLPDFTIGFLTLPFELSLGAMGATLEVPPAVPTPPFKLPYPLPGCPPAEDAEGNPKAHPFCECFGKLFSGITGGIFTVYKTAPGEDPNNPQGVTWSQAEMDEQEEEAERKKREKREQLTSDFGENVNTEGHAHYVAATAADPEGDPPGASPGVIKHVFGDRFISASNE